MREKGLRFLLELDPLIPRLRGDPHRLGQVLTCLADNAIKFSERGQVVIAANLEQQTETRARVRLSLRDTGISISPGHVAGLFNAFNQGDGSSTLIYGATGLGLTLARRQSGDDERPH